ncbi:MAG: hypothetical protein J6Y94_03110, partial [Bacteriovoracaceae bacterium]|nr:hypothetical protein [Bacteriovoracaceae bacterium]
MRLMIAGSMIILMGMFCISCGGTNKASRTVSTSDSGYNQVYCNQNYWYTVSGCMPPTTWTVPADFVLSNSWYPSVLNYTYPEWYVNAGLKVSFKSTCKDNNSCGKTLAGVEPYIVDPATRDDANTVY